MPNELLYVAGNGRSGAATMYDIASWLRSQVPSWIDPDHLVRLAREAERQAVLRSGIATMVRERTPRRPSGEQYDPAQTGKR
jgi:hypothetical protein